VRVRVRVCVCVRERESVHIAAMLDAGKVVCVRACVCVCVREIEGERERVCLHRRYAWCC